MKSTSYIFGTRYLTQHFLMTGAVFSEQIPAGIQTETPAPMPEKLTELPGKVLYGNAFVETVVKDLKTVSRFGAMAVRIDVDGAIAAASNDIMEKRIRYLVRILQKVSRYWGVTGDRIFTCVFPDMDKRACQKMAHKIQATAAKNSGGTVSIGVSLYPTINFDHRSVLSNALKALDHAAFFGHGSLTFFDSVSLNISGDKLYQKHDIPGAIEEFKTALLLDPKNVNVINSLGVCYGVSGRYDLALEEFELAMEIHPHEVMAIYNAGLIHLYMDHQQLALDYFHRAMKISDDFYEIPFHAGTVYMKMGDREGALKFLKKARKLNPKSAAVNRQLGEYYADGKKYDKARKAYEEAVRLNPNDAESLSALSGIYDKCGESIDIAVVFAEHSVAIAPENGQFRIRLGKLLMKQGRLKSALEQFNQASEFGQDASHYINDVLDLLKTDQQISN